jgi:hypothetical protein
MKPALEERETVINFGRLDKTASVYTSDETLMTKAGQILEAGHWMETEEHGDLRRRSGQ